MFEGFRAEYERIKKGSTKPSRLAPLLRVIQAYEDDPTERRLSDIKKMMLQVMMIEKWGVKNVVKKYGSAFSLLQREIEYERLTFQLLRQDSRTRDRKTAPKPRPPRSSPPSRSPIKSEEKGGRPAPRPPVSRGSLTPDEKRAREKILKAMKTHRAERGRRKLRAAVETHRAIRGIGYDVDQKGGFVPAAEHKEVKGGPAYKHLEPQYVWEAIDPEHHAGAWLAKVWQDWQKQKMPLSFWDFVRQNERNPKYENCYHVKYIEERELLDYKVTVVNGELNKEKSMASRTSRFDTSNMTVFFNGYHHGWGIYVQDQFNNIYSGPAMERDKITIGIDPESKRERVMDRRCQILHHSSFLAGKPTKCAGEWMVINGRLISISMMTGHYKTKEHQFLEFLRYLILKGVDVRTITVKWPWPRERDFKYYNGWDFFQADYIRFLEEPRRGSELLIGVRGPEKYYLYTGDEGAAPVIVRPDRSDKPVLEPSYEGVPDSALICSKCQAFPENCKCGKCLICGKDDSMCICVLCALCRKSLEKCTCSLI